MSSEIDRGFYQEFKRTPAENRVLKDRKRLRDLECKVEELENEIKEIKKCLLHQDG